MLMMRPIMMMVFIFLLRIFNEIPQQSYEKTMDCYN